MKNKPVKPSFSVMVALAMTLLTALLVLALTLFFPSVLDFYLEHVSGKNTGYIHSHRGAVLTILYVALVPVYAAIAGLLLLLSTVRRGNIFTRPSANFIGLLSACCYAEAVVCAILTRYFILGAVLCFAALLLGTLMLVVRSVIAQATEIKTENDFTV